MMPWGPQGGPSPKPPARASRDKSVSGLVSRACHCSNDTQELWWPPESSNPASNLVLLTGRSISPPSSQRMNFGPYDNYIPGLNFESKVCDFFSIGDVSKKSWNQQYFSQTFSKPDRPGKKWGSTPSELRENSPIGDIVKDDQKAAPIWMTHSLLNISEKPSAYFAARRKPPFFTGLKRTPGFIDLSIGKKKRIYKKEKNQVKKTSKKKMAGSPKGSKFKLLDKANDIASRESDIESKGSGESKPKNGMGSHEDKEPHTETKDMDVNKKNEDKKKKSKESDVESSDSKSGKKKDDSRSKSRDLDKGSKKKSKDPDFEFRDIMKKDKDIKKKSRDLIFECTGSKKIDKDVKKKCQDFNMEQKTKKKDRDSRRKWKDSGTEFKDAKKDNSWKKLNFKFQNLKMEDKKHKEGDVESQNANDSKKKSKESDVSKALKKTLDGEITTRGLAIKSEKREPETSSGGLSLRSSISQQTLPQIVKPRINNAPLPEAQWIQKLI